MNLSKTKNNLQNIRIIDVKKGMYAMATALLFTSISVMAQNTPPNTPNTSVTTSSTSSMSTSVITDDGDNNSHSNSISISQSNDYYRFKARYHRSKNLGIKDILISELGRENLKIKGGTFTWSEKENGENSFECKLSNGRLYMYLDTENASKAQLENIKNLGTDLKYYISGSSKSKDKAKRIKEAQRKLEQAQRELEAVKRNR